MKRFISVFLALVILSVFSGCNSSGNANEFLETTNDDIFAGDVIENIPLKGSIAAETTTAPASESSTSPAATEPPETAETDSGEVTFDYDTIFFGSYEQDGNTANGAEPIEWIVIDTYENIHLVVSKYALDSMAYNSVSEHTTWLNSDARAFLNGDFLNTAFTKEEIKQIKPTIVTTATDDNGVTVDSIFLLSIEDVNTYFPTKYDLRAEATQYAKSRGAVIKNGYCGWWLRGAGDVTTVACRVNIGGKILTTADADGGVETTGYAIRPALRVVIP